MCTPAGHTLMGLVVQNPIQSGSAGEVWKSILWVILLSNSPDIDFLFGFFAGNPNQYRHGWTHSLGFVVLVMCLIWLFGIIRRKPANWRVSGALVISHLLIDLFTLDGAAPYGMTLFWPVSEMYVIAPVALFRDVHKSSLNATFLPSLFSVHNMWTILSEILIFGTLFGVSVFLKKRKPV